MISVFEWYAWDRDTRKRPFVASDHKCDECGATADIVSNIGFYCHKCWSHIDQIRDSKCKSADQLERERIERMRRRTL